VSLYVLWQVAVTLLLVVMAGLLDHWRGRALRAEKECDQWRRLATGESTARHPTKLGHPKDHCQ
jgi:hypothetical protein